MILTKIADMWGPIKSGFEHSLGLSADAIHIHVGVALLLLFAWVTRRPLHDWRPWLMVFVVELANEIIDMNQKAGSIENNWIASRHDLLNTMFIPTLLVLYYHVGRLRQRTVMLRQAARTPAE
ncbi:hypothetical protein [Rhizorhapis sp. SPR117]|uniref:hypothetical protein n=1 Tax=Rhizorhapis sp. SPR117 TaxID=2912611 RepID=UPI001F333F00|nr:hypothetical protein [Rhizorhapis sp. SPR117]